MEELNGLPGWALDAGAAAFIGLMLVIMVARGWLVPSRTLDQLEAKNAEAIAAQRERADEWRGVAEANGRLAEANRLLAEQANAQTAALAAEIVTQTALLRSIREWAARRRDES